MGFLLSINFGYIHRHAFHLFFTDTPARGVQTYSPLQKKWWSLIMTTSMVDIPGF
jgi:hypothetical protein